MDQQQVSSSVEEIPTTSSRSEPSPEDLKNIDELMSTGKRNYVCGEYQVALENFISLCKEVATFYGEVGNECAEPYLFYGKTLLELARLENGVLGHALKETPALADDEEVDSETDEVKTEDEDADPADVKKRIPEMVQNAMRDGNLYNDSTEEEELTADEDQAEEKSGEKIKTENDEENKNVQESTKTDITMSEEKTSAKSDNEQQLEQEETEEKEEKEEADVGTDTKADDEDEEDISHLQLSWEMFELSAFICNRQIKRGKDDKQFKSFLAEAKYGLAQISMESERYEEAINDFSECLECYKEILEDKNDRRLAEINYNIALALSFDKQFDKAIEKYKFAVSILEAKVKDLEAQVKAAEEKGGKGKASPELEEWTKEIKEIEGLIILDMVPKIDDAAEMKKQADASAQVIKEATKEIFSAIGTSNSFDSGFDTGFDSGFDTQTKPADPMVVNDITNKVRSAKRKSDDEAVVEPKKAKTNEVLDQKENGAPKVA